MKYILKLTISIKEEYFIRSIHNILIEYLNKDINITKISNCEYIFSMNDNHKYVTSHILELLNKNIKKIKIHYQEFNPWSLKFSLKEYSEYDDLFLENYEIF